MSTAIAALRHSPRAPSLHRLSAALQLTLIGGALGHVLMNRDVAERLAALAFSH